MPSSESRTAGHAPVAIAASSVNSRRNRSRPRLAWIAADQLGRLDGRGGRERDHRLALAGLDALHADRARGDADADDVDELLGRLGQRSEAVGQLGAEVGELLVTGCTGQPLVERQSLIDLRDILLGQEPFDLDTDDRLDDDPGLIAPQFLHSFGEKLAV